MVGFPGEGELEFTETLNLLGNLPMSYLHVFPSLRAALLNKVNNQGFSRRQESTGARLRELSKRLRHQFMQRFVGTSRGVLLKTKPDGRQGGYTDNYLRVQLNSTKHEGLQSNRLIRFNWRVLGDISLGNGSPFN